jgi:hypothetical protein
MVSLKNCLEAYFKFGFTLVLTAIKYSENQTINLNSLRTTLYPKDKQPENIHLFSAVILQKSFSLLIVLSASETSNFNIFNHYQHLYYKFQRVSGQGKDLTSPP